MPGQASENNKESLVQGFTFNEIISVRYALRNFFFVVGFNRLLTTPISPSPGQQIAEIG